MTDKGLDLYLLLLSLKSWGEKWGAFKQGVAPAPVIVHRQCGQEAGLKLSCPSCGEPFGPKDTAVAPGNRFAAERRVRRDTT